jgi:hypothetical protein
VPHGLRRDHPLRNILGILAINIYALDGKIHRMPVGEAELALQIYLNKRSEMRLLGLVELIQRYLPVCWPSRSMS